MDERLKQRLVGAIVLIALAVIVVPGLLDGAGRRSSQIEAFQVPPEPQFSEAVPQPVARVAAVPKPAAAQTDPDSATAMPTAWAVQLGAFASADNAHALRDKLRKSGYAAFVESADEGPRYRVRIGPEADRAVALQMRDQLVQEYGQRALVVRYP